MLSTSDHIYKNFKLVVNSVKAELAKKGVAIPRQNEDGSVNIDRFKILKASTGFYKIINFRGDILADKINLPQTAAVLANGLALGKWLDLEIYKADQEYGYKLFEEQLYKKNAVRSLKNNNIDRADMLFTRSKIAHFKVETAKKTIMSSFEKLRRLN